MKKRIPFIVAFLMIATFNASAQGLVYNPFIPETSSSTYNYGTELGNNRARSTRPSSQSQTIRTTAYYADYSGDYYKVPIKVKYTQYSNGATSLVVAEQYESNALGGEWKQVLTSANVVKCQAITANGVNKELERTFMYKAMVGTQWYYFDL